MKLTKAQIKILDNACYHSEEWLTSLMDARKKSGKRFVAKLQRELNQVHYIRTRVLKSEM